MAYLCHWQMWGGGGEGEKVDQLGETFLSFLRTFVLQFWFKILVNC